MLDANGQELTDETLTWSSSNAAVATVKDGVVTGVTEGKAKITVKAGKRSADCTVTVTNDAIEVKSLKLDKDKAELQIGDSLTLTAAMQPEQSLLLGEERNIVTSIAGTTRDSIHTRYNKFGMDFYLVDTAGMRKKGKAMEDLEFYSVMRSIRAIENSDVCILMLDAQQGLESQDLNIHNLIVRNRKGCVIVVNKWDLIEKDNNTMKEWTEFLKKKLAPFNDIPIIFTSVLNKQRILEVLQTAIRVYENRKRRVATSALNDYLLPIIENYPPPATKGKYIKIKYVMQLPTPTPQFACFVNLPQYIKDPYRRFLENKIREEWDFSGVPIQIYFRQK